MMRIEGQTHLGPSASSAKSEDDPPDMDQTSAPTVTILMGLHNGARHLAEQLDSFVQQDHCNWRLVVSDDNSSDDGQKILLEHARHWQPMPDETSRLQLRKGPERGSAANYLSMLAGLSDDPGWLAFADQDDVWLPERLSRGLTLLRDQRGPACSAGAVWVTDEKLQNRRASGLKMIDGEPQSFGFCQALVQNHARGNTMLINPAAARFLVAAARLVNDCIVHDWWAYQVITGAGGKLHYDHQPLLLYRQHEHNLVGEGRGIIMSFTRMWRLFDSTRKKWIDVNIESLQQVESLLTDESRVLLNEFCSIRGDSFPFRRVRRLIRLGALLPSNTQTSFIMLACFLGRL